jgi:hypothetical protein
MTAAILLVLVIGLGIVAILVADQRKTNARLAEKLYRDVERR